MFKELVQFIRELYPTEDFVPLHAPVFLGNEKKYLVDCIDSTFVSSVGAYVDKLEDMMVNYTKSKYAIPTVNGTTALHLALLIAGVKENQEVLTQTLTFAATNNAISYIGAMPIFIDSAKDNLSMCPEKLSEFLKSNTYIDEQGDCRNKNSNRIIRSCIVMHAFGMSGHILEIKDICKRNNILLIEDAAQSMGSTYNNQQLGTFGDIGTFSFNGNKIITAGGGGVLVTDNEEYAKKAKHLSTTAKKSHPWEFSHDEVGFNYRMPNINAALLCAQIESMEEILSNKRETAKKYRDYFQDSEIAYFEEVSPNCSNYWLNTIFVKDLETRNKLLEYTNGNKIMTRPLWVCNHKLPHFKDCEVGNVENALNYENTIVNIPSGYRGKS